jgi:DNA-binding transcriptional regulator GbsR (MarR family)
MEQITLSEKQLELIERFGVVAETSGATPAQARISALLLVADETELTFDQIYQTLRISKSAASNALNNLLLSGNIEYITKSGDRKRYFRSRISQIENEFEKKSAKLLEINAILKEVLSIRTESTKEFNTSLKKIIDFMDFLKVEMPVLYEKWRNRHQ